MFWSNSIIRLANDAPVHASSFNPFHHLETPEEQNIASTAPVGPLRTHDEPTFSSPFFADYGTHSAVLKHNRKDALHESLAYQIGKTFARRADGTNMVPTTVTRNLQHPNQSDMRPTSAQKMVPGFISDSINKKPWHRHPDAPGLAMFDYVMGNRDRNRYNVGTDDKGALHAIDNGLALSSHADLGFKNNNQNLLIGNPKVYNKRGGSPIAANMYYMGDRKIPQHVRNNYLNQQSYDHALKTFNDATNHPLFEQGLPNLYGTPGANLDVNKHPPELQAFKKQQMADYRKTDEFKNYVNMKRLETQQQFKQRLDTMRTHLADPKVRTMDHLNERLHPGIFKHMNSL